MSRYLWSSRPAKFKKAIVIFVDGNYIPPASYVAHQLLSFNASSGCDVVIVSPDISELKKLIEIVPGARLVQIQDAFDNFGFEVPADFPNRSFLNLFLPHIFEAEYDRLICVDADYHVTTDDIFKLFELNMKTYPLAAVKDIIGIYPASAKANHKRYYKPANMHTSTPYLNGGFLVIDSKAWIIEQIGEKALGSTLDRGGPKYLGDQRGLNAILKGDWMELSPNCNWAAVWPGQRPEQAAIAYELLKPSGLHLLGASKPWSDRRIRRINPHIADKMAGFFTTSPWPEYVPLRDYSVIRAKISAVRNISSKGNAIELFLPEVASYLWSTAFEDVEQQLTPKFQL